MDYVWLLSYREELCHTVLLQRYLCIVYGFRIRHKMAGLGFEMLN